MAREVALKAFTIMQANILISTFKEVTTAGTTNIIKDIYSVELKRCKSLLQLGVGESAHRAGWCGASEA